MKGGGAPFCSAQSAAKSKMRSKKRPCQPKTAKRFFGGPGSHGPSGQAKERTRILPVRRGFSAPGAPRHMAGWPFLRGLPLLRRLLRPVSRRFSAGAPLPCPRLAGSLLFLRLVWPVLPGPACRLPAMRLCVRGFCCRCLACLARRAGVQGGAAARRLCVCFAAGGPASCGCVSGLRVLPLLCRLLHLLPVCPPCALCVRVYSFGNTAQKSRRDTARSDIIKTWINR